MSPMVSKIHSRIFAFLKTTNEAQRQRLQNKLKYDMSNCRDFVVIDSNQKPIVCGISLILNDDLTARLDLLQLKSKILHTVPVGFEQFINQPARPGTQPYSNVICIMMDIAGSTQYATTVTPDQMAELMHDVYMAVNDAILREIFPYAYIHEICGDSLLLIVNAGFMVSSHVAPLYYLILKISTIITFIHMYTSYVLILNMTILIAPTILVRTQTIIPILKGYNTNMMTK
eukprot:scaffold27180_cov40-Prasinocladus_malaysianus.AAC.1